MTGDADLEFVCVSDTLYGEIPEPQPATKVIPEWYKKLEMVKDGVGPTVRSCMSFLDAMTWGWIIPAPFDMEVEVDPAGSRMDVSARTPNKPVSSHTMEQLGGDDNPAMPLNLFKFRTPWLVRAPEGVSALVTSPMNRRETRWTGFAGIVEVDQYFLEINLPCIWEEDGYEGTIEQGTPLIHVVPFERDGTVGDGVVRSATDEEREEYLELKEAMSETGYYRENVWEPKNQPRLVDMEEP